MKCVLPTQSLLKATFFVLFCQPQTFWAQCPNVPAQISVCVGEAISANCSACSQFNWTGQNPNTSSAQLSDAGSYTWSGKCGTGPFAVNVSGTLIVAVNQPPSINLVNASPDPSPCVGQNLNLNDAGSGGSSWNWVGPDGTAYSGPSVGVPQVSMADNGVFSVTVTGAGPTFCEAYGSLAVTVNPAPAAAIGTIPPTAEVCTGEVFSLEEIGGNGVSWSWSGPNVPSGTGGQSLEITETATAQTQTYSVTVTDANGCVSSDSRNFAINSRPAPVADNSSSGGNTVCENTPLHFSVTAPTLLNAFHWEGPNGWSSDESSPTIEQAPTLEGEYFSVTVTDVNGCTATAETEVFVRPAPKPQLTVPEPICTGYDVLVNLDDDSVDDDTGYTFIWDGPNGFDSSDGDAWLPNIQSHEAGTYSVTVTNADKCTATASADVIIQPGPQAQASSNSPVPPGGTLELTGSDNNGFSEWKWKGPNGFTSDQQQPIVPNFSQAMVGVYTVIVNDFSGCLDTIIVIVEMLAQNCTLAGVSFSTQNVNCFGENTGTATVSFTGGNPPFNFVWKNAAGATLGNSQTIQNLPAGQFFATVTDNDGCEISGQTILTQPANALIFNVLQTQNATQGNADGSATLVFSGGTPPFQNVDWQSQNNAGTLPISGGGQAEIQNLTPGNYSATLTDANGCTASQTFVIQEVTINCTLAGISFSSQNINCFGESTGAATVSFTGGNPPFNFLWKNAAGATLGNSQTTQNLPAGQFFATVTDNDGCEISGQTTLTQPANALIFNVLQTQNATQGNADGSATLVFSGGTPPFQNVDWQSQNNAGTLPISGGGQIEIQNLAPGNYSATLTDANGCQASQTFVIQELTINCTLAGISFSSQNINCFGESTGAATVSFTGGNPPFNFVWKNAAGATLGNSQTIQNLPAGQFFATVTDNDGCEISGQTTLTQPSNALTINVLQTQNASVGNADGSATFTFSGGTPPFEKIDWQNQTNSGTLPLQGAGGSGQAEIENLPPGNYSTTLTDANGCTVTQTFVIQEITTGCTLADLTFSQQDVNCFMGNDGWATVNFSGGTPPFNFVWKNAFGATVGNGQTAENLKSGNYFVTVTDADGCEISGQVFVSQPSGTVSVNLFETLCPGETYPFCGQNLTAPSTNTCTLPGANGCDTLVSLTLIALQPPVVAAVSNSPVCAGDSLRLAASAGAGNFTWQWGGPGGFQSFSEDVALEISNTQQAGQFSVTATDQNGCTSAATLNVEVFPKPAVVALISEDTLCAGETLNLFSGGNAGWKFDWQGPDGYFSTLQNPSRPNATPSMSGSYELVVTDLKGCSNSTSVAAQVLPLVSLNLDSTICAGETVSLGGQVFDKTGVYKIKLPGGCDTTLTLTLEISSPEKLALKNDVATLAPEASETEILVLENDTLPAAGWFLQIVEQPFSGEAKIENGERLHFELTETGFFGLDSLRYAICSDDCQSLRCDTATLRIFVQNDDFEGAQDFINDVLSPGASDGKNDLFDPVANLIALQFEVDADQSSLAIYNRWGERIFVSDPYRPWNGTSASGLPVPQATYYYVLRAFLGEVRLVLGAVTVLR